MFIYCWYAGSSLYLLFLCVAKRLYQSGDSSSSIAGFQILVTGGSLYSTKYDETHRTALSRGWISLTISWMASSITSDGRCVPNLVPLGQ